ncbi:Golgi membrane protein-like protein [Polychaeton citri CBS 116435]|uniref:Protein CASP n=1 Tax=Polychaeton citri CBS 116435 TaxID=1314669 RepID=A0A9P4UVN7_9PEZI|nr:Golgi membrane protein-like protein [Polychaeton citri CBS 116435]
MADKSEEQILGKDTSGSVRDAVDAAGSNGDNTFQQAVAAWRALDLTKLVATLDTTASDVVSHQKESLVQRKELAQKTKDFKKLDDVGKLADVKDLLKAYQNYVDLLTNQSKNVQAAFMSAYSPLSEAPDPYPLLDASIEGMVASEEVVPRLEEENQRLQKTVSKQNSSIEELELQLEKERGKRQDREGSQDTKIKEVEDSWAAVVNEKEDNWAAKEKAFEEKVESQDRLLKELKANYEVSQRLEKTDGAAHDSGRSAATSAELDIVSSELERTNARLAELESRNEQLRVELAQTAGQANSSSRTTAVEDDPAYLRLRSENSSLLRKLETARDAKDTEKSKWESKIKNVERERTSIRADRDALQYKVQRWSDYDQVKGELDMLRAIEFATVGDDDDDTDAKDPARTNGSTDKASSESLERLLLARNKKLNDELAELRVSQNEMQEKLQLLQDDLATASSDLTQARELNATLENDLQKTQQEASTAWDTASMAPTYTSRYPTAHKSVYGSASRRGGGTSPTSSIISGFDPGSGRGSPRGGGGGLESLRAGESTTGQGILPMVTAQRDRFKKKIGELEGELQKQYSTVSALRSEISSLQKDNLNLYEKTRYISSFSSTHPTAAGSGAAYSHNTNPSSISIGGSGATSPDPSSRYKSTYESNISPFAAFRGRESARALKRMTLPERAVFQITRMVLATRTSRNLFAAYCMGLHVLVLMMLYWLSSADEASQKVTSVGGRTVADSWQKEGFDVGGS